MNDFHTVKSKLFYQFSGHGTASASYRPEFLDHFDKKEADTEADNESRQQPVATQAQTSSSPESAAAGQMLQKQLQQIAGGQPVLQNVASAAAAASNNTANNPSKFQQCIAEGDLDFVSFTSFFNYCGNLFVFLFHS